MTFRLLAGSRLVVTDESAGPSLSFGRAMPCQRSEGRVGALPRSPRGSRTTPFCHCDRSRPSPCFHKPNPQCPVIINRTCFVSEWPVAQPKLRDGPADSSVTTTRQGRTDPPNLRQILQVSETCVWYGKPYPYIPDCWATSTSLRIDGRIMMSNSARGLAARSRSACCSFTQAFGAGLPVSR